MMRKSWKKLPRRVLAENRFDNIVFVKRALYLLQSECPQAWDIVLGKRLRFKLAGIGGYLTFTASR